MLTCHKHINKLLNMYLASAYCTHSVLSTRITKYEYLGAVVESTMLNIIDKY